MAYLLNNRADAAATHALVIGVGKYELNEWQLPDLGAPAWSAAAFARWLVEEYRNPDAPLASVEVLCSPAKGAAPDFRSPDGTHAHPEPATLSNVEAAFKRWFALCEKSVDNLAVLYFCGHGLRKGLQSWLLLEGFAAPGTLNYDDSINFSKFVLGMERCMGRKQVYFLDACRNTPPPAKDVPLEFGKSLVDPDDSKTFPLARECTGVCSAAGQAAFGRDDGVSRLTGALLTALRGAGWDDRDNPWNEWFVKTDTLLTHVRQLLRFEEEVRGLPAQAVDVPGYTASITFHHPPAGAKPAVPLLIAAKQPYTEPIAFEVTRGGALVARRDPMTQDWEPHPFLEVGDDYTVTATPGGAAQPLVLRPAYRIVRV